MGESSDSEEDRRSRSRSKDESRKRRHDSSDKEEKSASKRKAGRSRSRDKRRSRSGSRVSGLEKEIEDLKMLTNEQFHTIRRLEEEGSGMADRITELLTREARDTRGSVTMTRMPSGGQPPASGEERSLRAQLDKAEAEIGECDPLLSICNRVRGLINNNEAQKHQVEKHPLALRKEIF